MPRLADDALCIRHWDWSETSQTVSLFGRAHGLVRGLAKGARRERGRFGGGFDLLTRGEVLAVGRPDAELLTLTDWAMLESFPRLRSDLAANRAGFYLADLLGRLMAPHDPHPEAFDAAVAALRSLERGLPADEVAARYQRDLLASSGFLPPFEAPEGGGPSWFHPREGVVGAEAPGAWRVRADTLRYLASLDAPTSEEVVDESEPPEPPREVVARAAMLLAACVREVIGEEPLTMRQMFPRLPRRADQDGLVPLVRRARSAG